jgi:hypothetical protein
VRRWYAAGAWGFLVVSVFWGSLLTSWCSTMQPSVLAYLLPGVLAVFELAAVYGTIAAFVNRTTIAVRGDLLSIRHGPLPWGRNEEVAVGDIAQLYTEEEISRGKRGPDRTYHLYALLRSGERIRLLETLPQPEQALWLEQRIEDHLGIADAPVPGEWAGAREPAPRLRVEADEGAETEAEAEAEDDAARRTRSL